MYIREIRFGSSIHVYPRNPLWKFDSYISEKSALEVRFMYIREIRFGSSIHVYQRNPLWEIDSCYEGSGLVERVEFSDVDETEVGLRHSPYEFCGTSLEIEVDDGETLRPLVHQREERV